MYWHVPGNSRGHYCYLAGAVDCSCCRFQDGRGYENSLPSLDLYSRPRPPLTDVLSTPSHRSYSPHPQLLNVRDLQPYCDLLWLTVPHLLVECPCLMAQRDRFLFQWRSAAGEFLLSRVLGPECLSSGFLACFSFWRRLASFHYYKFKFPLLSSFIMFHCFNFWGLFCVCVFLCFVAAPYDLGCCGAVSHSLTPCCDWRDCSGFVSVVTNDCLVSAVVFM